jgi:hypothetical protein
LTEEDNILCLVKYCNPAGKPNKSMSDFVKIVVFVPVTHADKIREVLGKAGAGKAGNYSFSSFSVRGTGRFKPEKGADPAIGRVGKYESVEEERIEVIAPFENHREIVEEVKKAHPYEEPAIEVYATLYP